MPKYLVKASYTPDGVQGIMKEGGTGRRDAIGKLIENMNGTMESFHFAFGDHDVYVIAELPDNVSAAAVAIAVNSTGAVHLSTDVLLTPEEVDKATKTTVDYRPPGAS